MMNDDQSVITVCVLIGVASTIAADFFNQKSNGKPSATEVARPVIAGAIAGTFLFGIALVNSKVAKDFAILFALAALLRNGNGLFSIVTKLTGPAAKKPTAPPVHAGKNLGI